MDGEMKYIPVVFDKSHLLTIGERLYSTSLDLIRELVSNAYDADATEVKIEIQPGSIVVEDNGSCMDEARIRQYFTIGSQEKRMRAVSPKFGRKRIGEFGIANFPCLPLRSDFSLRRSGRKSSFAQSCSLMLGSGRAILKWQIPCKILPYDVSRGSGTRITITRLKKSLDPSQVTRAVRERLPVAGKISVFL